MPYITKELRAQLAAGKKPATVGELNYSITKLIMDYYKTVPPSYGGINDIFGVLEATKHEFQRRVAAPYESYKRDCNGDVY